MAGSANATVVVTGSAGFIGGYVVEELLARGYSVVGVDNLSKYGQATRATTTIPATGSCRVTAATLPS